MADIPLVMGITHHPFYYQKTSGPRSEWSDDAVRMAELAKMMEDKLSSAQPDALVVVASDHFHQFFMNNMPAFLIAKMEEYDGIFYNETREFDLQPCTVPGAAELSGQIATGLVDRGVDLSFSNDLKLDHSVIIPLMMIRPRMDLPVVPLLTNCGAQPMPTPRRFFELGRILREAITEVSPGKRVAVVLSGNLSLEVGGPRQFAPEPPHQAFDDRVTDLLERGDHEALIAESQFDRLVETGNTTGQFLNFLTALGLTDKIMTCTYAEAMKRKGSSQPYFVWEKAGVAGG
ncbi:MAG: extradiol ring-cleavage dioxygenase [Nitriliruptorales bacterium]|nr:extradiol ring-cleavage dioxygenase [Nitriliruptorales bacterium]